MEQGPENNAPEPKNKGGFQKGVSGNPGGRPKAVKELVDLARKHGKDALRVLKDALGDDDARVRITAAQILLDRGYGKAPQAVEHSGPEGVPLTVTIDLSVGK